MAFPLFGFTFPPKIKQPLASPAYGRRASDRPLTNRQMASLYRKLPSFTNHLPWLDVEPEQHLVLLSDGISLGLAFEAHPVSTEAKPDNWLRKLRDDIQGAISSSIPEQDEPWVLQLYVQDELRLDALADEIAAYADPAVAQSQYSLHWFGLMREHLEDISRPAGLFVDEQITGGPWRGLRRKVRGTLYRPRRKGIMKPDSPETATHHERELLETFGRLSAGLSASGIKLSRMDGKALYNWLFRWFNPNPETTGGDTEAYLKLCPYPDDDPSSRPYGWDVSECLLARPPQPDPDGGIWWLDGLPHRAIVLQGLNGVPAVGALTHERSYNDKIFALFDKFPPHSILALTITVKPQDTVRSHLLAIERASYGDFAEAKLAAKDAGNAQISVAAGNALFPVQAAIFIRGDNAKDLKDKTNQVNAHLLANRLRPIREQDDLCPLDAYLKNLPMAYDPGFDEQEMHRSRLMFCRHIANLAPLYGRSRGSGNLGLPLYNRGGEPLAIDPIRDRKKNAHALIVGPPGSGKSSALVYIIMQYLAIYRPRVVLIESGNSFGLLGQYLEEQGLTVNALRLTPGCGVSLPPFADALRLLDTNNLDLQLNRPQDLNDDPSDDFDDDGEEGEGQRDILGEMEIAARIMITGGEAGEESRMTRSDRLMIRTALVEAAKEVKAAGRKQVLTEDVEKAMRQLVRNTQRGNERAEDMADALGLFCTPGSFESHLFNRPGKTWPDYDVTILDLGLLAREGYQDKLAVAYIGLMNAINNRVEHLQHEERPTLVITDEGHIVTTNPLLAPYVIKITKMWRKLGAWFWIATQNLEDFPEASRRMLTMMEWWFCLVMPKNEIEQIARFRKLTEEQNALLLAARKSPGLYTEGVVLSDDRTTLFRNVPPAIALALGMTEKEEKAKRAALMREHRCSELEAAKLMAQAIAKQRSGYGIK